jgi:FlaG/FlaF family flagellin (archaellin)
MDTTKRIIGMETTTKRIIGMAAIVVILALVVGLFVFSLYEKHQSYDELFQVDGEVLEKSAGVNYIFIVKEDNGHIVKFTVDFEEYYTYDVGSYYSGEIRRGNFIEGP